MSESTGNLPPGHTINRIAAERDRLRAALKDLIRAYVVTLESARDRIVFLGGECDAVDVMERGDPNLIKAKQALAGDGQQSETSKPSRDAEHCDYPDCEQHNALVVERLTRERDAAEERSKACDQIAEGDYGWETLERLCIATMSVCKLRSNYERLRAALQRINSGLPGVQPCDRSYEMQMIAAGALSAEPNSAPETFDEWVIVYADQDRITEHFSGAGAQAAAEGRFRQLSYSWTCRLFRCVAKTGYGPPEKASDSPSTSTGD